MGGGFCFVHRQPAGERSVKMDVRLYVGNMAKSTTADDLRTLFAQAGNVSAVDIIKDRDTGQSKGFGFVTMTDQVEAEKAIGLYNAYSMADHELKVNVAKPRV
jgi:RNA recognition motif-containing protein